MKESKVVELGRPRPKKRYRIQVAEYDCEKKENITTRVMYIDDYIGGSNANNVRDLIEKSVSVGSLTKETTEKGDKPVVNKKRKKNTYKTWTKTEEEYVKKEVIMGGFNPVVVKRLAKDLGRTLASIDAKIRGLVSKYKINLSKNG